MFISCVLVPQSACLRLSFAYMHTQSHAHMPIVSDSGVCVTCSPFLHARLSNRSFGHSTALEVLVVAAEKAQKWKALSLPHCALMLTSRHAGLLRLLRTDCCTKGDGKEQ